MQYFLFPPGTAVVRCLTADGAPLLAREVGGLRAEGPRQRDGGFDEHGGLLLAFEVPAPLPLRLWTAAGSQVADGSRDPAVAAFKIPDPEGRGVGALTLGFELPGRRVRWATLPPQKAADEAVFDFAAALAAIDLVALVRDAEGSDQPGLLMATELERRGLTGGYPLVRRRLAKSLEAGPPGIQAALARELSKLVLIDAFLLQAGVPSPFDLDADGLRDKAYRRRGARGRPAARPGRVVFPVDHDFWLCEDPRTGAYTPDPTGLFGVKLALQELEVGRVDPVPWWLLLHTHEWGLAYYGLAWVNGQGPYCFVDDPREPEHLPAVGNDAGGHRRLAVRLPAGLVQPRNRVEVRFRPFLSRSQAYKPMVILQGLELRAEPGGDE